MTQNNEKLKEVLSLINDLCSDIYVSRIVKTKLNNVLEILNDNNSELSLKVDKAISILDELNEDPNIPAFTRTQLWNVVSLLSSI